jgi:hypothetical protein
MYRVNVPKEKIANADLSGATKNVITSLMRLPQKQRFVFVANLPPSLSLNLTEGVTTQQEIVDQLKFDGLPWRSAQASANYTPIPMWGQIKDSMLINSASSLDLGKVYLVRSMARIDVKVAVGIPDFEIETIYVCNSSDSGYIAPLKSQWGEQVITKTNTTSKRVTSPVSYSFPSGGAALDHTIYVPETDSLIINGSDSVKPAYLVIQARYKGTDNYYRIDFTKDSKYHPLLRNHGYPINIIGAKDGYQTLDEAVKAPLSNFSFSLTLDESEHSDINEVVYLENQYMMGINVSQVLFDWDTYWIGGKGATDATKYPLSVYTTYTDGWTATLSGALSWVTLTGTSGAKNKSGKVTIQVTEENRTGAERTATLTIRAGMLVKEVTIRQSGGANSRMICFDAGSTAKTSIPLAFADAARGAANNPFAGLKTDDIAAKVIWQEAGEGQATFTAVLNTSVSTIPKDCHIEVTAKAGTKKSGNAIVAIVRKGSGASMVGGTDDDEVLWSWHVWSMPDDEYMDKDYHNPNVSFFMKRTLGRYDTNKGMFYQWGRKDPFPQATTKVAPLDVANRPVEKADNVADNHVIRDPASFYYKVLPTYPYWTGSTAPASDSWQTATTKTKTYYDPCPVGWRVPDNSDKDSWTAGAAGDFLNGGLSEDTGIWSGTDGIVWTSTAAGSVFTLSGSVPVVGSSDPSAGHSVRCVKDIQLIKTSL